MVFGINMNEKIFNQATANNFGTYMNDGVRKIDFVLVYPDESEKSGKKADTKKYRTLEKKSDPEERRKFYEQNLVKEGLQLEYDKRNTSGEELVFVKVHAPWHTLGKYAEELKVKSPMKIHEEPDEGKTDEKKSEKQQSNILAMHAEKEKLIVRKPFHRKEINLYEISDRNAFFTDIQRMEITEEILKSAHCDPNNLKLRGIEMMLDDKIYESAYPLHDCEIDATQENNPNAGLRQLLHDTWARWKFIFKVQPLTEVRNYYGEQIAFYFAWMDVYARMLVFPAIAGMCTFIYGLVSTALSPEYSEICHKEGNDDELDSFNVAPLHMCPICKPPSCEAWEMIEEGCFQYGWNFRLDNECSIFLSVLTSLWSIVFLKVWKRREASLAAEWDTEDAENTDTLIRPEYAEAAPTVKRNLITGQPEPFIPPNKTRLRFLKSIFGTSLFLLFTILCLTVLVLSRIKLYGALRPLFGGKSIDASRWLTHGLLLIMIMVLEMVFNWLAEKLTDIECPKTQHQWMKSFLWKIYIFQFINDFVPIMYAAWIKGKTTKTPLDLGMADELCDGGCIGEVAEIVAVLLLLRLVLSNTVELGYPMLQTAWRRFRSKNKVEDVSREPQYGKDLHLNEIELDGVSEDLMQMMIQYAFNVLFIPALPVVPLVCLINTIIQTRLDSIKYLHTRRRPVPIRTSGLHIWNQFLDVTAKLGVIVNAAMLAFTSDNVAKLYYKLIYNPGNGIHGFTRFSLDSVPTKNFDIPEEENEMLEKNITECWYPGFRESEPPFPEKKLYHEILTYQITAFVAFNILLFTIMFVINTFVSDVPQAVKEKIQRRHFLIAKAKEISYSPAPPAPDDNLKQKIKNHVFNKHDIKYETKF